MGFFIPIGKKEQTKIPIKSEPIVVEKKPEPVVVKKKPKKMVKQKPKPVVLVEPKDDDNDGVLNKNDSCLSTPAGKVVNSDGCMKIVRLHVNFANDKYDIRDEYILR